MLGNGGATLLDAVAEVDRLAQSGDVAGATAKAREAVSGADAAMREGDRVVATALNRLGMFFFHHSHSAQAITAYRAAMALMERIAPGDGAGLAQLHNNLGQALGAHGQPGEGVPHLKRALALAEHTEGLDAHDRAVYSDNLGALLFASGGAGEAVALHEDALLAFERLRGVRSADVATALGNLGNACHELGQRQRALACLLRSLDIHIAIAGPQSQGALVSASNLMHQALDMNDVSLATDVADVLLALAERDGADHNTAVSVQQCAVHAFNAAQLGLADRLAQAASNLLVQTQARDGDVWVSLHRLRAKIALRKGDTARAARLQLDVLEPRGHDARAAANDWIELAKSLRETGPLGAQQAVALCDRALNSLRVATGQPGDLAHGLLNLAESLFAAERLSEADRCFDEAMAALGPRGHEETRAIVLHAHGLLDFRLGRHAQAAHRLQRAMRSWQRRHGSHHAFVATAASNLALVLWDQGDAAAAERMFERAQRLHSPTLLRNLCAGSDDDRQHMLHASIGDLYRAVSLHLATGVGGTLAARLMVQHKGAVQLASARVQARLRERLDPHGQRMLDRLTQVQSQITALLADEQVHRGRVDLHALAPLQHEAADLQRELGHRGAHGHAGLAPPSVADVRAKLPAGAVLIDFLRAAVFEPRTRLPVGTRYAALVLRKRAAPRWIDLGDARPIDEAVHDLRAALHDEAIAPLQAAEQALVRQLVAPLDEALAGAQHVIVAPDGELNLLPLATLLAPRLRADTTVQQVAGTAEWIASATTSATAQPSGEVIALVDPDFHAAADGERSVFEPLPATRREGEILRALWPGTRVLAGSAASADALRQVRRPALLHVATHGHFTAPQGSDQPLMQTRLLDDDNGILFVTTPERSARDQVMHQGGLALAGADRIGAAGGIVSAAELALLDLRGTALVVLSACDTGVGRAALGSEFGGLRRAFAIAGARSQLTSLWSADDEATAEWMTQFYRALHAGRSRAQATRDAQLAVRAHARWAHPFYWAGFVLWGDDGPLPQSFQAASAVPTTPIRSRPQRRRAA